MASMNISLPDPMRDYVQHRIDSGQYGSVSDYVRDLIRRDQSDIDDERRWLSDLDRSIEASTTERDAGGGIDIDTVARALLSEFETMDAKTRR